MEIKPEKDTPAFPLTKGGLCRHIGVNADYECQFLPRNFFNRRQILNIG